MIKVILYSRQDCPLCDEVKENLSALQEVVPHELHIVDIDSAVELQQEFNTKIPVVEIGPYRLKAPIERLDLEITLKAAQLRDSQITEIDQAIASGEIKISLPWTRADRFSLWMARHYLAVCNLFLFIYVGLPFLAPVLMKMNAPQPARIIYRIYGAVCHQLAFRSFFVYGEQWIYPRSQAHIDDLIPYGQATGLNEADLWEARQFLGNELLGYKAALCERDVAIYLGLLLFGLVFALARRRFRILPWYLWFILGILPMGLDGLSQLISQPPFNILPYRETTPLLRILTGWLFGFLTAWFGYPMVEESMNDTMRFMEAKKRRSLPQNPAVVQDHAV